MNIPPLYLVSAARTPVGAFMGSLSPLKAPQLGALALRGAAERAGCLPEEIEEVFMGHVLTAGCGQAPTRQAALGAGIPQSVPCTGISKVCGSGLQAVVVAARTLVTGEREIVLAGGMESMSNAPYYLEKARSGYRLGHGQLLDGMILDGLWDPYHDFHMGEAAEKCAARYDLSRQAQDDYATRSYQLARQAQASGAFAAELIEVPIPQKRGEALLVARDEEPERGDPSKFSKLRPAFTGDGTITAANASSLNDGAAAVVLASQSAVARRDLKPLARIIGWGSAAQEPEWFTTAPAKAIGATLESCGLSKNQVDLWEINEAFSCVPLACAKLCGVELERVNVHGGAVALGHPIGASGTRVLTTLAHALRTRDAKIGIATLCIGGGEAVAVAIERV